MNSAVYEGTLVHHRLRPVEHRFSHRLALPLVDLDELDELCALHPLWSVERRNGISFRRADYLPGRDGTLADAARSLVEERLGARPGGPVRMLAHPRTWGWLFNPISVFYCSPPATDGVAALVCEVTNTPWHERHVEVVGAPGRHVFAKALHVSPFLPMDMDYELSYTNPGERLGLAMRARRAGTTVFSAALSLERREVTRATLGRLLWHPGVGTIGTSAGIYRQALSLTRAGAPFFRHPSRPANGRRGPCGPPPHRLAEKEVLHG